MHDQEFGSHWIDRTFSVFVVMSLRSPFLHSTKAESAPLLLSSPVRPTAIYRTLYRGEYAFRVQIYTPQLGFEVYHEALSRGGLIETFVYRRVWVGEDRHGPMKHRGATLLFEQSDRLYLYVGESIVVFRSLHPIVDYHHVMGGHSILYPVAVDSMGNHYPLYCNQHTDLGLPIVPSLLLESMQEWDVYNVWYHKPTQRDPRVRRAAHTILLHVEDLESSDVDSDLSDASDHSDTSDTPDDRLVTVTVHRHGHPLQSVVFPAAYGASALLHRLELDPSKYRCTRVLRPFSAAIPGEPPVYQSLYDLFLVTDGDHVHVHVHGA